MYRPPWACQPPAAGPRLFASSTTRRLNYLSPQLSAAATARLLDLGTYASPPHRKPAYSPPRLLHSSCRSRSCPLPSSAKVGVSKTCYSRVNMRELPFSETLTCGEWSGLAVSDTLGSLFTRLLIATASALLPSLRSLCIRARSPSTPYGTVTSISVASSSGSCRR